MPAPDPARLRQTSACAALTSEDLPMPRAPQSSALLAGRPSANRRVLSSSWSAARSMPLSRASGWRLTCCDGNEGLGARLPHEGLGAREIGARRPRAAPCARARPRGVRGDRAGPSRQTSARVLAGPGHCAASIDERPCSVTRQAVGSVHSAVGQGAATRHPGGREKVAIRGRGTIVRPNSTPSTVSGSAVPRGRSQPPPGNRGCRRCSSLRPTPRARPAAAIS